jgi:RNA polymerase sigma-70 factor, ECF subfamily
LLLSGGTRNQLQKAAPLLNDLHARQINEILIELQVGNLDHEEATDRLFSIVYRELHSVATGLMCKESAQASMNATDLVHEAYLRLVRNEVANWENRAHFFGVAARAMRQILVDHARKKQTAKRGGDWQRVTLTENIGLGENLDERILDLDTALTRFSEQDNRMARIAELRIFGGLQVREIAHLLSVSRSTVQGDWRLAKMWLNREMQGARAARGSG